MKVSEWRIDLEDQPTPASHRRRCTRLCVNSRAPTQAPASYCEVQTTSVLGVVTNLIQAVTNELNDAVSDIAVIDIEVAVNGTAEPFWMLNTKLSTAAPSAPTALKI